MFRKIRRFFATRKLLYLLARVYEIRAARAADRPEDAAMLSEKAEEIFQRIDAMDDAEPDPVACPQVGAPRA